jgi:lipopolysaccharide transport system ATP-binding protein
MSGRVIEARDLGKRYRLGTRVNRYETIREAISGTVRGRLSRSASTGDDLWALRHVSFDIDSGETVGIIGPNGAGKTTLLKVLARITDPTEGFARTRGRVGALLEIGTGFHPELTGRENIYLSGAVLGMSKRDIARRFDAIVSFAEVERFLDTPLKRYSAGMYLRLAFAVAAHLEPAIVMVDEVLAVGDVEFRHKCLTKVHDLGNEGRTVLFVSHDLGAITRVCPRVIWLDRGLIRADGAAAEVVAGYMAPAESALAQSDFPDDPSASVQPLSVELLDADGMVIEAPERGQALGLRILVEVRERVPNLDIGFELVGRQGVLVLATSMSDELGESRPQAPGTYYVRATIPPILAAGEYMLRLWIGLRVTPEETEDLFYRDALNFRVWPRGDDRQHWMERGHVVQPQLQWRVAEAPSDIAAARDA